MNFTPDQLAQGGALTVLAMIVIAFYTGRVITSTQAKDTLDRVTQLWQERFSDVSMDRDGWKAQAQQLAPALDKLADELEEHNRLDEAKLQGRA